MWLPGYRSLSGMIIKRKMHTYSSCRYAFAYLWWTRALLLYLGFNRCPYQLLYSVIYKKCEESKRKIWQECSSMQQADYQCHRPTPWMQESVAMHKSPTPVRYSRMNQARSEKETGKTVARRLMERKAAQQSKNTSEELKQGLPRHSSG